MQNIELLEESKDRQNIIHFIAAHLEQIGQGSPHLPKLLEDLKLSASSPDVLGGKPILEHLFEHDSRLLQLLMERYGVQGFYGNLIKFCLRSYLKEQIESQSQLCKLLIDKSKLLFNRVYYKKIGHQSDFPILHSTTLTDLADQVSYNLQNLESLHASCSVFFASNYAGLHDVSTPEDMAIARLLEFNSIDHSQGSFFNASRKHLRSFNFLESIQAYLNTAVETEQYTELAEVSHKISQVHHGLLELESFAFPEIAYFEGYEKCRRSFLEKQAKFGALLWGLNEKIDMFLSKRIAQILPIWPESINRRMRYSFLIEGQSTEEASELCDKLESYCKRHSVSPEDMLDEEWQKIDKRLKASDLALLKSLFSNKMPIVDIRSRALERETSLQKSEKVLKHLAQVKSHLLSTSLMVALFLFINGCGIKTKPVSKVVDPRPTVPFIQDTLTK